MTSPGLWVDFSRPPTGKEHKAFKARQARLKGQYGTSAAEATSTIVERLGAPGKLSNEGLRIRTPFCYLDTPIPEAEVSDRRAPHRSLRPPATMIASSQGAALRLYLTGLAVAQVDTRPGRRAKVDLPLGSFSRELGWSDLVASSAVASGRGQTTSTIRDKKTRALRSALDTLEEAGLVHLPGSAGRRGRHEGFTFLDDAGWQLAGNPLPYIVPAKHEDYFTLPPGFITNGWVHVLEDSEITLLLMVACGRGGLVGINDGADIRGGEIAIPAEVRLRRYGIHRDPFSAARKTLAWFGLLDVREVGRHDDGRAENATNRLHRLSLAPDGFQVNACETVTEVVARQLDRHRS
jgi:hypothetical protein